MFPATNRSCRYAAALGQLAEANRQAEQLAGMLDHFAAILRGSWPDLDGPPLESFLSTYQIISILDSRTDALERVEEEWRRLPVEERVQLPAPDELS
jgi:hypothetical protein